MSAPVILGCDEHDLVALCRQGNDEAFAELYRRHRSAAVRFASRVIRDPYIAEDIAQQALIKAFRSIRQFRQRSSFQTWLYRLTLNEAFSHMRRRSWSETPVSLVYLDDDIGPISPEQAAGLSDLRSAVRRAVAALHPQLQAVVAYKYYHGLTDREIAARVGCPTGTVKSRLHRARNRLRAVLPADIVLV